MIGLVLGMAGMVGVLVGIALTISSIPNISAILGGFQGHNLFELFEGPFVIIISLIVFGLANCIGAYIKE